MSHSQSALALTVNDQQNPNAGTWNINEGNGTAPGTISRTGAAPITVGPFGPKDSLIINGSSVGNQDLTYNVSASVLGAPVELNVFGGASTQVNVNDERGGVTVSAGGENLVNVSISPLAKTAGLFDGDVTVTGGAFTHLNVFDENDTGSETWTMSTASFSDGRFGSVGTIASSQSPAQIDFSGNLESVPVAQATIDGGKGNTIFNIDSVQTGTSLWVAGGAGTSTFNVSPVAADLDTIQGSVQVEGGESASTLNIDDSKNPDDSAYNLTNSAVSRTAFGTSSDQHPNTITINYSDVQRITVNGGGGDDAYTVQSTPSGTRVNVKAGSGNNTLVISPTAESLGTIQGSLSVAGGGGNNTLIIFDDDFATTVTYSITSSTIARHWRRHDQLLRGERRDPLRRQRRRHLQYREHAVRHLDGTRGRKWQRIVQLRPGGRESRQRQRQPELDGRKRVHHAEPRRPEQLRHRHLYAGLDRGVIVNCHAHGYRHDQLHRRHRGRESLRRQRQRHLQRQRHAIRYLRGAPGW